MKLIQERKINGAMVGLILYLSFCVSSFYFARGELGYTLLSMSGAYQSIMFSNSIAAFFFGGLIPFMFYQILVTFSFRLLYRRLGEVANSMKYALMFFYIGANLVIGVLSLLYLISPLVSIYGGVLIPFLSALGFFAFYIRYVLKHYVEKQMWSSVVLTLSGFFCLAYAFITVSGMGVI